MDYSITNWFYNFLGDNKPVLYITKFITFLGESYVICLIIAVLLLFKKTRKIGLYAGVACLLGFVCNNLILKNIVKRARPFTDYPEFKSVCQLAKYSFPNGYSMASGHATATMALAFSVFLKSKKTRPFILIYPIFVGLSRIILCVHYTTDVIVGFGLGLLFATISFYLIKYINKLYLKARSENNGKIDISN